MDLVLRGVAVVKSNMENNIENLYAGQNSKWALIQTVLLSPESVKVTYLNRYFYDIFNKDEMEKIEEISIEEYKARHEQKEYFGLTPIDTYIKIKFGIQKPIKMKALKGFITPEVIEGIKDSKEIFKQWKLTIAEAGKFGKVLVIFAIDAEKIESVEKYIQLNEF